MKNSKTLMFTLGALLSTVVGCAATESGEDVIEDPSGKGDESSEGGPVVAPQFSFRVDEDFLVGSTFTHVWVDRARLGDDITLSHEGVDVFVQEAQDIDEEDFERRCRDDVGTWASPFDFSGKSSAGLWTAKIERLSCGWVEALEADDIEAVTLVLHKGNDATDIAGYAEAVPMAVDIELAPELDGVVPSSLRFRHEPRDGAVMYVASPWQKYGLHTLSIPREGKGELEINIEGEVLQIELSGAKDGPLSLTIGANDGGYYVEGY